MDFHKISESEDAVVYQAMVKLDTKPLADDTEVVKYGAEEAKINDATFSKVLEAFDGYDIDSVTVSKSGGITVRVARDAKMPEQDKEPDVDRLESRKGGKSK